ncbi:hypothetical protein MRB53_014776 [Persea americana]|uniref:Uncharacterized protein n=1 Tax=Persea americana TaxID=3435 RepID=A0ACC2KBV6_PERAE|nr:hypothetical protein MRB53_014776 [Persea americana]
MPTFDTRLGHPSHARILAIISLSRPHATSTCSRDPANGEHFPLRQIITRARTSATENKPQLALYYHFVLVALISIGWITIGT